MGREMDGWTDVKGGGGGGFNESAEIENKGEIGKFAWLPNKHREILTIHNAAVKREDAGFNT